MIPQCKNVKQMLLEAPAYKSEPPKPLRRATSVPDDYPTESLGPKLAKAARAIHEKIQAPEAICAQAVLSAASLAVQGHADVELPTGQRKPLSNFFVSIAASGERKTSADNEAIKPIKEHEELLREKYKEDYRIWKNKNDAYEKQRSTILKGNKLKTIESLEAALNDLGNPPLAPLTPILTCAEPTFEGLCKLWLSGQPSMGILTSEGGQFIGGYSLEKEQKLKTAAAISSVWDGEAIKRIRSGDGVIIMPGKRLSMHLMIQPGVASKLLSDTTLQDQGFLSRILISAPATMVGSRFSKEIPPTIDLILSEYTNHIKNILALPLPLKDDTQNELNPRCIKLSENAKKVFLGFADHIEKQMASGGSMEPIRGFANKLPEHAVRLAGVIALMEDINIQHITEQYLALGIDLAQYYASEALRLIGECQIHPDILLAEKLLDWMQTKWSLDIISLPNIYQLSLNAIKDQATARRIVHILADHGWLITLPEGAEINGERRKEVWRIIGHENDAIY